MNGSDRLRYKKQYKRTEKLNFLTNPSNFVAEKLVPAGVYKCVTFAFTGKEWKAAAGSALLRPAVTYRRAPSANKDMKQRV